MLRLSNININIHHTKEDLLKKISNLIKTDKSRIKGFKIIRKSIDARKKQDILFSYILDIDVDNEDKILKKNKNNSFLRKAPKINYIIPKFDNNIKRPVIIGFGPAGLFAALYLARAGLRPIVIERGEDVDKRSISVDKFWKDGTLNTESNVSFGEGGAGTFSDGKLNTLVKDNIGRNTFVLNTFVEHGANEEILYDSKPHIGTDKLKSVIKSIREEIIKLGGEIKFSRRMDNIIIEDGKIRSVKLSDNELIDTDILILAIGHSARDSFKMLEKTDLKLEAKSFAVGLRVQHLQKMIDISQYGEKEADFLSPASYKLTYKAKDNRGVYSFCMCPGGYVINASTDNNMTAVNGMSYNDRNSGVANSAIIVTVDKNDFYMQTGDKSVLAGLYFQEKLERLAYELGNGFIPIQSYSDFRDRKVNYDNLPFEPKFKGGYKQADLNKLLPEYINDDIKEAFMDFNKKIAGFADEAILAGVESRTSSPIRILRDDNMESNIKGIFPCGEGAGYAGGITSAAMDGLKVAESVVKKYVK